MGVPAADAQSVGVAVGVGVGVLVWVGVDVGVRVSVGIGVRVGVAVRVGVTVIMGVGVAGMQDEISNARRSNPNVRDEEALVFILIPVTFRGNQHPDRCR
jgi:hypothetical protein